MLKTMLERYKAQLAALKNQTSGYTSDVEAGYDNGRQATLETLVDELEELLAKEPKVLELAKQVAENADPDDCPSGVYYVDAELIDTLRNTLALKRYTVGYKYGKTFGVRPGNVTVWAASIDDAKVVAEPVIRSTYRLQVHVATDTTPIEIINVVEADNA